MLFTIILAVSILSFIVAIVLVVPFLRQEYRDNKQKKKG